MRISDWSSDVCSSDLLAFGRARRRRGHERLPPPLIVRHHLVDLVTELVEVDAARLPILMSAEHEEDLVVLRQKLVPDILRVVVHRVDRLEVDRSDFLPLGGGIEIAVRDRKSTRLNSS